MKKKRQLTDRLAGMPAPDGYKWISIRDLPKHYIYDGPDCYPWREVYAWLPVKTVAGKYVWRQRVYKRRVWVSYGNTPFHSEPLTEYATAFDLIKYERTL